MQQELPEPPTYLLQETFTSYRRERERFFSSWNFDGSLAENIFFSLAENFYCEVESRVEMISIAVSHYVIRIKIHEAK